MDLKTAQENFLKLIDNVEVNSLKQFLDWIKDSFTTDFAGVEPESNESDLVMHQIVDDIRPLVPFNAVLPSEQTIWPEKTGSVKGKLKTKTFIVNLKKLNVCQDSDCDPKTTVHVDAFLYDENDVDELCEDKSNAISRNYCLNCSSHATAPLSRLLYF